MYSLYLDDYFARIEFNKSKLFASSAIFIQLVQCRRLNEQRIRLLGSRAWTISIAIGGRCKTSLPKAYFGRLTLRQAERTKTVHVLTGKSLAIEKVVAEKLNKFYLRKHTKWLLAHSETEFSE